MVPKPPKDYRFMKWNWPLIRKTCFWSLMSVLAGCTALVIGVIATMPKKYVFARTCRPKFVKNKRLLNIQFKNYHIIWRIFSYSICEEISRYQRAFIRKSTCKNESSVLGLTKGIFFSLIYVRLNFSLRCIYCFAHLVIHNVSTR